jgi:hypothetical protein
MKRALFSLLLLSIFSISAHSSKIKRITLAQLQSEAQPGIEERGQRCFSPEVKQLYRPDGKGILGKRRAFRKKSFQLDKEREKSTRALTILSQARPFGILCQS